MNANLVAHGIANEMLPAINKVICDAETLLKTITGMNVQIAITTPSSELSLLTIQQNVCVAFHVSWREIISKSRQRNITNSRFAYCWLCRNCLGMSLKSIANTINRDHTTVIHAVSTINDLLDTNDPEITPKVLGLQQKFLNRNDHNIKS